MFDLRALFFFRGEMSGSQFIYDLRKGYLSDLKYEQNPFFRKMSIFRLSVVIFFWFLLKIFEDKSKDV